MANYLKKSEVENVKEKENKKKVHFETFHILGLRLSLEANI
jgi:hypothetical protein